MKTLVGWVVLVGWAQLSAAPEDRSLLDVIRERGALRWGGDESGGAPYVFRGPEGKLTGFEVEIAEILAARLGVRRKFVHGQWDKLPQLLDRGEIDIVLNGYEWTSERESRWASTIPYYVYRLQLLTRRDPGSILSWDGLRAGPGEPRKRVGVLSDQTIPQRFQDTSSDTFSEQLPVETWAY